MGTWVILSFLGVMFNPGNAGIWTRSLMWSLLACVVVMPGLVIVHHATRQAIRRALQSKSSSPPPIREQTPFIDDEAREQTWSAERQSADRN
jgi:hypothetical protein